ncbi:MAG: NADH-quinone oxidoreductase subunit C [Candidatus Nitrosocaldus sp.]
MSQQGQGQAGTDQLMVEKEIVDKVIARFGEEAKLAYVKPRRIRFNVSKDIILDFARYARDELGFDHPISVAGVDYPKNKMIDVIYHIGSCTNDKLRSFVLAFAVQLDRNDTVMPTLIPIYRGVEYHEREAFEMLGVIFEGHPRLERLLLPEDWADIPPLRKDFHIKGREE